MVAPPGVEPIFITPDQRFLGFEHPQRSGTLIYDQGEKRLIFLQRPANAEFNESLAAVAFSPLNALVALAFNDSKVYLYDLFNEISAINLDPIANVDLKNRTYAESETSYRYPQSIVMRFEGIFRYLTVIYSTGSFGRVAKTSFMTFMSLRRPPAENPMALQPDGGQRGNWSASDQ